MDYYALDANAIREDPFLRRTPARLLLREARHQRIGLLIPQIAFDEVVNLHKQDLASARRKVDKGVRSLRRLGLDVASPTEAVDLDEASASFAEELREIFLSSGGILLPYPQVDHAEVVRRALDRCRPFDSGGKDGYRDTVLWETLCEAATEYLPVTLISADRTAFSPNHSYELLAELRNELQARGLAADAIRRIPRIADFTDQLPRVDAIELELEHMFAIPGDPRSIVVSTIEEEALDYDESQTSVIGLNLEVDQLFIESVQEVSEIALIGAWPLEGDENAFQLEARMVATLELFIRKGDLYSHQGDEITVIDADYNESFGTATICRVFSVRLDGTYDSSTKQLREIRTSSFTAVAPGD